MEKKHIRQFYVKRPKDARDTALYALLNINENGRKANVFLRETLDRAQEMEPRDRALCEYLTQGTLSYLYAIDDVLGKHSKTPVSKLNPTIREILRMAVYQLLYADRIPASAAINEAVELARIHGLSGLSGFVNGVLRNICREAEDSEGAMKKDPASMRRILSDGAVRWSVPKWLYKKLVEDFGQGGAEAVFQSWLILRKTSVRLNLSRASEEQITASFAEDGIHAEKILDDPKVYELDGLSGFGVGALTAFRKGWVTVQDASAAMLGPVAAPKKGDVILDLCAAPGGKSLLMADMCGNDCTIEARDVSPEKTKLIDENAERCGFTSIHTKVCDALREDKSWIGKADIVIADLPCSGLGVVAKKPDIKKNLTPESITELAELQREMLKIAVKYVRPGGKLIYSTCTITKEENEQNAYRAAEELGLKPYEMKRIMPDLHHDGFFIAGFTKID